MTLRPALLGLLALLAPAPLGAQVPDTLPPRDTVPVPAAPADTLPRVGPEALGIDLEALRRLHAGAPLVRAPFVVLSGTEDDRIRVRQLLGVEPTDGYLIRSPSSLRPFRAEGNRLEIEPILPRVETVWNSAIPFSFNDGALWAGRGSSLQVTAGVRAAAGPLTLTLAPQFVYEENADYDVIFYPNPADGRSPWADPFVTNPESFDQPSRFGDESHRFATLGQSSLALGVGPVGIGVGTENQWWGPGIRNAIVMSNHAAGIPHFFVRTDRPLSTFAGDLEARVLVGWLTESDYFDFDPENDRRSLSAVALAFRPAFDRRLTVGLARGVYEVLLDRGKLPKHAFNFLKPVGRPNARSSGDFSRPKEPDQVFSLFGRYVFPEDGLEVYAEWARTEPARSARELLLLPNWTQGYTVGVQWARRVAGDRAAFRVQAEATDLEQNFSNQQYRWVGFYKSRPVPQGYTERGQWVGAAIGHGSSSQWLAADWMARRWSAGAFAGRVRWQTDSFFGATSPNEFAYDVSVWAGLRAGVELPWARVDLEASTGSRYNFMFQFNYDPDNFHGIDKRNHSLRLTVTTLPGR